MSTPLCHQTQETMFKIATPLACCNRRASPEATLAAVCGWCVQVCGLTTARAGARTSGQTWDILALFGRVKVAHPSVLFDLLRCNSIAMAWRILWYRLTHTVGWRRSAAKPIRRRRPAVSSPHGRGIPRGLARPSRKCSVHSGATSTPIHIVHALRRDRVRP